MSTALSVYQRMPDPVSAVKSLGLSIAKSGMFGTPNVESGEVLALECLSRGVPPLSLVEDYDIIFGKLSMKASAKLKRFNLAGGKHEIISRTSELVAIRLTSDGKSEEFSLSWEDAQKEPFPYAGKEQEIVDLLMAGKKPKLKPKYATPRARTQMLWSRLISDAIGAVMPAVSAGAYTPEEVEDYAGPTNGQAVDDGIIEGEVISTTTNGHAETAKAEPQKNLGTASKEQVEEIRRLFKSLTYSRQEQLDTVTNYGVDALPALSDSDAAEIIGNLAAKLAEAKAAQSAMTADSNGLCTDVQIAEIKGLMDEVEQLAPGSKKKFKDAFLAAGYAKFSDLSWPQAVDLIEKLKLRNLDAWLTESIRAKN